MTTCYCPPRGVRRFMQRLLRRTPPRPPCSCHLLADGPIFITGTGQPDDPYMRISTDESKDPFAVDF